MIRVVLTGRQVRELEALFAGTDDRRLRDRAQIVLMAHRGRPRGQIASDLGVAARTVQRWVQRAEGQALAKVDWTSQGKRPQRVANKTPGVRAVGFASKIVIPRGSTSLPGDSPRAARPTRPVSNRGEHSRARCPGGVPFWLAPAG